MLYNSQPNRNFVRLGQSYEVTVINVKNITGRQADIIWKKFHEIFGRFGFQVEKMWCNHRVVNFLAVTLNRIIQAMQKARSGNPLHQDKIQSSQNHHQAVSRAIEKRINELSENEKIFKESSQHYQEMLKKKRLQARIAIYT